LSRKALDSCTKPDLSEPDIPPSQKGCAVTRTATVKFKTTPMKK